MKKFLIAFCTVSLLVGCSGKEQTGLKESLVAKFKDDQDLKDYNLAPETVADCVVEEIGASLPGFMGDPRREQYFEAYAHFVNAKTPAEAEKAVNDYQQLFGTLKEARTAAMNVTNHVMTCMGKAMESGPQKE